MGGGKRHRASYGEEKKQEVLQALEKNGGNVAKTSRETGVGVQTIKHWRDEAKEKLASSDLKRFTDDSWHIIHKANEVVREKVDELGAKDAASIASGYFDRQAKAAEQMTSSEESSEEYAAQWDSKDK